MNAVSRELRYPDLESLPTGDVLALILRDSSKTRNASGIVSSLVASFPSLRDLFDASFEELDSVQGIGRARALRIKAAVELARRYATLPPETRTAISCPSDVARLLGPEMRHLQQEVFRVLLLNTKNEVLRVGTVSVGTLNASLVHPREVFREAIKRCSAAVILVHNHPSGQPQPSSEDITLTRRLVEAGKLLGIEVLDHVVIGNSHFSFKERGML